MANNKIAVKVFLGCLCCFVLIMGLNAADGTSGSGSTGSSGTANCTTVGETQEKYTADSNCGYSTQTRTCCSNKYWSGWDEPCPGAVQLVAERSTESLTLTCSGYSGAKGNVECWNTIPARISVPYPKCPETNICDGKSVGYKCYESYSPTAEELLGWNYAGPIGSYIQCPYGANDGRGCCIETKDLPDTSVSIANAVCESTAGGGTGGGSSQGGTAPKVHNHPQVYIWRTNTEPLAAGSFTVNVVTCKQGTSGGGTGGSGGTSGGGTQI